MSDSLVALIQTRLGQLYTKTQDSDPSILDGLLNTTFAPDARIILNHESISLDKYKDNLTEEMFAVTRTDIEWKDIVDLIEGDRSQVAIVAGCFTVTQSLKIRVRGGPIQKHEHNFFSAKVVGVSTEGGTDNRRISEFILTSINKPVPIELS